MTKVFCNFSRNPASFYNGNEDNSSFARFFKLHKKIIITLRRAQKFGDSGPYKNFDFLYNPLMTKVFYNFSRNLASF